MEIVDAVWEQRNLGVSCAEITIHDGDLLEHIESSLNNLNKEYLVVKVPTHMPKVNDLLQENGFRFIETTIDCVNLAEAPILDNVQKRVVDSLSYSEMHKDDFNQLFDEIKNNMFEDDRISVDQNFTQDQANNRYIGWINDEIDLGSKIYKICFKENIIGFFLLKKKENNSLVAVLGGIYKKYRSYGFGFSIDYLQILEGIKQKVSKIRTSFSTNNRS